jgi:hypothetical protein
MEKIELSIEALNEVAGGMIKTGPTRPTFPTGTGPTFPTGPFFPTGTGPTFPTDPIPTIRF